MAENQLLDTFYQMMPKSLGNGQSCNNLATDLISLLHSISPSLILCPSFSSFPLILSLCSVNQTIRGVVCLSLTTLPNWPPVPYNVMTIWEEEISGFVHMCVVQHPLQVMWAFGFVRSSEIPKTEFQKALGFFFFCHVLCIKCIKQNLTGKKSFRKYKVIWFWTSCTCLTASV